MVNALLGSCNSFLNVIPLEVVVVVVVVVVAEVTRALRPFLLPELR